MPTGVRVLTPKRSRAELRIRVEQLLTRREPPPNEDWESLGEEALALLVELLDDPTVKRHDALRHRVIATLGQLSVSAALPRLGALLTDSREKALTRTYSASALGRSGLPEAVPFLGSGIGDNDDMVRRQVALSLARSGMPSAIPYLTTMLDDGAEHVAEIASEKLRDLAKQLRITLRVPRPSRKRRR